MAFITPLIMAGGSLLGGSMGANASKDASQAQQKADAASILAQERQFNIGQQALAPYQAAGQTALTGMMKMLGMQAPQTTTPYGYSVTPKMTGMGNIYAELGLGGNGNPLAPPPGRPWMEKAADPGNLFPSSISKPVSEAILNSIGVPGGVFGNPFGGLAHGGTAHGGRDYVVGEKGPEVLHMNPGASGHVTPNNPMIDRIANRMEGRMFGGPVFGGAMLGTVQRSLDRSDVQSIRGQDFQRAYQQGNATPGGNFAPNSGYNTTPLASPNNPNNYEKDPMSGGGPATGGTTNGSPPSATFDPNGGNGTTLSSGQTPNDILQSDPSYQFRLQQGQQALDTSAAAQGGLLTGGHGKSLLEFGQQLASQEFNDIYNRMASIAGIGQTSTSEGAGLGASTGYGEANSLNNYGYAGASGYLGANSSYMGALNGMGYGAGMYYGNMMGSPGMPNQLNNPTYTPNFTPINNGGTG